MSQTTIKAALYAAVSAVAGGLTIAYPNAKFDPPAQSAGYLAVAVNFAQPENGEMGRGRDREIGYLEVLVRFPLGAGEGAAQARCEAIAAAFPQGTSISCGGGIFATVDRPPEIRPGYRDADRWAQPVRVRFFANL